jgi:hypothetical protein
LQSRARAGMVHRGRGAGGQCKFAIEMRPIFSSEGNGAICIEPWTSRAGRSTFG